MQKILENCRPDPADSFPGKSVATFVSDEAVFDAVLFNFCRSSATR
jgi:hypothetical protein